MNDEFEDYMLPHFRSMIPKPTSPRNLSAADTARFTDSGLVHLPTYLSEVGIGGYKADRLVHCGPAALDGLVAALKLDQYDITASGFLAVYYTSLGLVEAVTSTSDGIIIDPIAGQISIIRADPQDSDPIRLEFDIPSILGSALDTVSDNMISTPDGSDLHITARKELGNPEFGQCFGFDGTVKTGLQFTVENARIVTVVDHLGDLFQRGMLEITDIAFDPDAIPSGGEAWGDDLYE